VIPDPSRVRSDPAPDRRATWPSWDPDTTRRSGVSSAKERHVALYPDSKILFGKIFESEYGVII
jgi:hypothetical protein